MTAGRDSMTESLIEVGEDVATGDVRILLTLSGIDGPTVCLALSPDYARELIDGLNLAIRHTELRQGRQN